jgi:hypothetical protein
MPKWVTNLEGPAVCDGVNIVCEPFNYCIATYYEVTGA